MTEIVIFVSFIIPRKFIQHKLPIMGRVDQMGDSSLVKGMPIDSKFRIKNC